MTGSKEQWSIWLAVVYFEDNPNVFKERPVVILDDHNAFCLSLKVTSQKKDSRYHVELKQWKLAGLDKPSWVDVSKKLMIQENNLIKRIGKLDMEDILVIMRRI